jgi:hypothetical protein
MLYKLIDNEEGKKVLEPQRFFDASELNLDEKGLENLLASNLFETLFEDNSLLPIKQERKGQSVADIYALDIKGDLVIFELKVGDASSSVTDQILGYTEEAGQWTYFRLNREYREYCKRKDQEVQELKEAHKDHFALEHPLEDSQFNTEQHLYVIGSSADEKLARAIDYWRSKGLSLEFLPYRIYEIGGEHYLEFFAKPNDIHHVPGSERGVMLDTNRSYDEDAVWKMLEKGRAAAYGDATRFAHYINPKDYVFLSHKGYGLIAGGVAISDTKEAGPNEKYVNVEWKTPIPSREEGIRNYLPFRQVREMLGHNFFWARAIKTPYLSIEESEQLMETLTEVLKENQET